MVVINSIEKGIVIDHIHAGYGTRIIDYLKLNKCENTVAFIMNAPSKSQGKKDLIKIDKITDVNLDALGLIDHEATVNVIENHVITKKIKLTLPQKVTNVIKCKNPRCVTSIEDVPHVFHLINKEDETYRCEYCDETVRTKGKKL